MSNPLVIADRVEITALCGEVTDAVMMRDFDRVASLFTPEAVLRWPHIDKGPAPREGRCHRRPVTCPGSSPMT